jgi:ubiquinone/menaquinone biosynthesis C-methylase UbiE
MNILDVGCGAGKLSFLFDDYTKGAAKITGGDFSEELLDKARAKNKERGSNIDFQFHGFQQTVHFADNTFDLLHERLRHLLRLRPGLYVW